MKGIKQTRLTFEFCDSDYLDKLNDADAAFLIQFCSEYYCHPTQKQIRIHDQNAGTTLRRSHRCCERDALMQKASPAILTDAMASQFLSPEAALILSEEIATRIRKRIKQKANLN